MFSDSPRVCEDLTVCKAGEYEAMAPTATSDRSCALISSCTASMYEEVPPTSSSDRICSMLTTCSSDQYVSVLATETSDRVCTARVTSCLASEYMSGEVTAYSDRFGANALSLSSLLYLQAYHVSIFVDTVNVIRSLSAMASSLRKLHQRSHLIAFAPKCLNVVVMNTRPWLHLRHPTENV